MFFTQETMNRLKIFFVFLFSLLVLPNLGTKPLWQDEAETALVARQMVKTNTWLPYAFDDQGPISQDWNYQFKVSPLWRWHPWLQFYVTALSFKLLGVSAFAARLPFALIGTAAYWYFLNFLTKHSPSLRGAKRRGNLAFFLTAAILFLLSTPLLLHLRQSRYYSLSLFFTLLTIDGYLDMQRRLLAAEQGDSSKYSLKYILGSILLFHSFLPGALTLQLSFLIRTVLAVQGQSLKNIKRFIIAFSTTLPFTLPWAIWLKIGGQNLNFSPELIKQHLIQHYLYIHKFIFPALTLIPIISPSLRKRFFRDDKLILFSIFISISLLLYTFNHPYFFRYLVPLIPFFIYIAAWIIATAKPIWAIIPLISLILITAKTFPKFLLEIAHPYQNANAEIIAFLSSLDHEKYQKLAINYDDFTFRFHTSFTVYGAQQLESPCPDVIIIFPDWGNEEKLRQISQDCQLTPHPLLLHYARLGDDPDQTNHKFSQPPLRTLEAFLAPPSPS